MTNALIAYGVKDDTRVSAYRVTAYYSDGRYWRVLGVTPVEPPPTCDICAREGRRVDEGSARCWTHWPVREGV